MHKVSKKMRTHGEALSDLSQPVRKTPQVFCFIISSCQCSLMFVPSLPWERIAFHN